MLPKTAWKPGQSGNPAGRPKGKTLTEKMREMLAADPKLEKEILAKVLSMAKAGDLNAAKLVIQYLDGQPISRNSIVDTSGQDLILPQPILVGIPSAVDGDAPSA